jgi:hypothetical protein
VKTIFLEFRHENGALAANGTDVTMHLDGRWGFQHQLDAIADRVHWLRTAHPFASRYQKQLFVGYTISGRPGELHVGMADNDPPEWAAKAAEAEREKARATVRKIKDLKARETAR